MTNGLLLCATIGYATIATSIVIVRLAHFELIALALQYVLLLPALTFPLIRSRHPSSFVIPWRRLAHVSIIIFALYCSVVSWRLSHSLVIPDESSYRFQSRLLAAGTLMAQPPPGASAKASEAARPVRFSHILADDSGWYSKYPIGWPIVLSLPETLGIGWLVTPILGVLLLVLVRRTAREVFEHDVADATVVLLALAPSFQASCVGRMPHALEGLIVAGATLLCLYGIRARHIPSIMLMFGLLVAGFHVRPYTSLCAAVVLGIATLWAFRRDRLALSRVVIAAVIAASVSIGSLLAYNRAFTGDVLLSPYAAIRGRDIPVEIAASPSVIVRNITQISRGSLQSMSLFSFPLFWVLAAYGYCLHRKASGGVSLLAALFVTMVAAHLVQIDSSSSFVGERYWFEVYFAAAILAASALVRWTRYLSLDKTAVRALCIGLLIVQSGIMAAAADRLFEQSEPRRKVHELAMEFANCNCVVFLRDTPPVFYGEHLNLNGPGWPGADVFYAVDPGESEREEWARLFGKPAHVTIVYDASTRGADVERRCGRLP